MWREDATRYGDSPEWSVPGRHDLGAVLLDADRPADADADVPPTAAAMR